MARKNPNQNHKKWISMAFVVGFDNNEGIIN
jgi:hypothetical protein